MTGGRRLPLFLPILALPLLLAVSCGGGSGGSTASATPSGPVYSFGLGSQVVVGNGDANNVSAIVFAPDGRMFYAEQFTGDAGDQGVIRVVGANGTLQSDPFATLTVANYLGIDWGLTGLALDPDFATNHYVYAFYTAVVGENIGKPTLVRFTDLNGIGTDQTVISDDFPQTFPNFQGFNANGDIHFGPDGYLYLSLGDYDQGGKAENTGRDAVSNLSNVFGKILRINKTDGAAAPDNPFVDNADADPRIFAHGFREPFPFAFDASGNIYGTDNTPDTCEELNLIKSGQDYGWPSAWAFAFADCTVGVGTQPIYNFARDGKQPGDFLSLVESQGVNFLSGSTYTELKDSLLVCESEKSKVNDVFSPGAIRQFVLSGPDTVASSTIVVNDCKGDVVAQNGVVYYANNTEIRKLIQGQAATTAAGNAVPAPVGS